MPILGFAVCPIAMPRNFCAAKRSKRIAEEGTYFIADLLGCEVHTEEGEFLGVLTDVTSLSSDIYTVKNGEKELRFPAVRGVIKSVDTQNKKIVADGKILEEICV